MRSLVVLALVVCVMLMVAWPMVASGYLDLGGGSGVSPSYLAYTDWPKLHPDRVDEINARNAYLAYTDWPKLHPDRVDEINARNAYLAYTDWPKLHPDRVDEINARR